MEQDQQAQAPKKTASQRIEELEQAMMSMYSTANNMARDIMTMKEAIKLLGNKVDSIVKASERGEELNDDTLSKIMIENNTAELATKVQTLVQQGFLSKADSITEESFVVGKEVDDDGNVMNPRLQFAMKGLQDVLRSKIVGSKAGDILTLEEGKLKFEVVEVYDIVVPKAEAVAAEGADSEQDAVADQAVVADQAQAQAKDSSTEVNDQSPA